MAARGQVDAPHEGEEEHEGPGDLPVVHLAQAGKQRQEGGESRALRQLHVGRARRQGRRHRRGRGRRLRNGGVGALEVGWLAAHRLLLRFHHSLLRAGGVPRFGKSGGRRPGRGGCGPRSPFWSPRPRRRAVARGGDGSPRPARSSARDGPRRPWSGRRRESGRPRRCGPCGRSARSRRSPSGRPCRWRPGWGPRAPPPSAAPRGRSGRTRPPPPASRTGSPAPVGRSTAGRRAGAAAPTIPPPRARPGPGAARDRRRRGALPRPRPSPRGAPGTRRRRPRGSRARRGGSGGGSPPGDPRAAPVNANSPSLVDP